MIIKWYAKPLSELNSHEESLIWKHCKSRELILEESLATLNIM